MFLCLFIHPFSLLAPNLEISIVLRCEFSSSAEAGAAGRSSFFWPWSLVARAAAGDPAQWLSAQGWLAWTLPVPSSAQS